MGLILIFSSVFLTALSSASLEGVTDILTDIYIERGIFSRCIRYALSVTILDANSEYHTLKKFAEYAIGNGVIISTSFGARGYYSYLDRITVGKRNNNNKSNNSIQTFPDNRLGICHILPTFLVRKLSLGKRKENKKKRTLVPSQLYSLYYSISINNKN